MRLPSDSDLRFRHRIRMARAFTLVEVLVASAVFVLLLGVLVGAISSVTALSSQASSRLDSVRVGREIFDLMQKDLAQIATLPTARRDEGPLQFVVNPPNDVVAAAFKNPTAFFWQASVARDRSRGNLGIVGYFVQRPGGARSQLRRVIVEPAETTNYGLYGGPGPASWLSPVVLTRFAAADSGPSASADRGWVADGVLGLWVRCLDIHGNVITEDGTGAATNWAFDSLSGYRSGSGPTRVVRRGVAALPAFVDVGIVCVAARDADRLTTLPPLPGGSPNSFEADVQSYAAAVESANPNVNTVIALTRRFRLGGGN